MTIWARLLRTLRGGQKQRAAIRVQVFTRQDCCLCDEVLRMLRELRGYSLDLEVIDIDKDAELVSRYGDKVPVVRVNGKDRFFGKINAPLLRRVLRAEASEPPASAGGV